MLEFVHVRKKVICNLISLRNEYTVCSSVDMHVNILACENKKAGSGMEGHVVILSLKHVSSE